MSAVFPGAGRLGAAVARVLDGAGAAVGAGFVIGPGRIATCAHVVIAACASDRSSSTGASPEGGQDADREDPVKAVVMVDFPLLDGAPRVAARVHRWEPVRADGRGDIAILEIDGEHGQPPTPDGSSTREGASHASAERTATPPGIAPPPLWRADRPWGREFRAIGFPSELSDGVWVWGEFRAPQGSGWLQLHAAAGGQPITGGFSGSPVWDVGSEAVVGMAVAADRRRLTRTAFMIPVNEVLGLEPALLPNPYRGLEPFGENDSHLYYGRGLDVDRVVQALRELSVVAVVGRSGIGKSSLVMAGVAPRVRAVGVRIEYLTAETSWAVPELATGEQVLLVADQFEELVATDPRKAREQLRDLLIRAADPAVRVLLTLSWDVLESLADDELGHALDRATIALSPMGREQLRQAIRGPASHAPGADLADDLVERLIDDTVGEPGGLPLLESVLTELWEHRTGGRVTLADYEGVGYAAASIARRAERVFGQFTDSADQRAARRLLTMLAAPRGDGFVRVPVSMRDVPELRSVAGRLARERLVVTGRGADDADMVELAHQSLIRNWPRLREWLELDRDFLEWQQRTERQRRMWVSQHHDDGELLRGGALSDAEEWLARRPDDIPDPLRHFITAALRARRREVRRWRVITAVLGVVTLVAAGTAVFAYRTGEQREAALRSLAGSALAERSLQLTESQPNLALQFAQAAARLAPGDHKVEAALLTQQLRLASATSVRTGLGADIRLVAADDTGSVVAIGDGDGTVAVWPGLLDGGADPWRLPVRNVMSLTLSGNGAKLATVSTTGGVQVWDVARRTGPFLVRMDGTAELPVTAVAVKLSADGSRLVVSLDNHRAPLPVDHRKRVVADVGDADIVETYDTSAATPVRLASYSTGARADLLPLQVDSSRGITWFHEATDRGAQRYVPRLPDGTTVSAEAAQGTRDDCGDGRLGEVVVREPTGARAYGVGPGCLTAPSGAVLDRDRTGRYLVISYAPEGTLFQLIHLVDTITHQRYKVQARYQSIGKPSFIVRPTASGPELFVIGANDLTRHAPAAEVSTLVEFGATPTLMTWSRDSRYVAEFHSDAARVDLREMLPQVRQLNSVTLDASSASHLTDMAVTADGRFLVLGLNSHELQVYSISDLKPIRRVTLPVPPEYRGRDARPVPISLVTLRDDSVAVLHAGYVTRWRVASGEPLGGPQQVWRDDSDFTAIAENAWAWSNGTAIDDLLIFTRRDLVVWDSATGRRVRVLAGPGTGWIDSAFKTLDIPVVYVWTELRRVERWDTATGKIIPAPVAIPWAPIVELTPNGLMVAGWTSAKVQILDAERGTLVNARLPGSEARTWVARTGNTLLIITDNGLLTLNLDREHMLDRLCAISDRDFTEAERKMLPPGADATPPCRG